MVETALKSHAGVTAVAPARGRSRPQSVVGLDLLRLLAAVMVMAFHMACTSWIEPHSEAGGMLAGTARYPELLGLARNGWVGVQMFFVISGYVIAFSAETATPRKFLRSRILRLAPGIWVCSTISLLLALAFEPDSVGVSLERYARTLVIFPIPRYIDGVYWTLSIEMAFYAIVWGLLMRDRLASLERVMIVIGAVSTAVWVLAATPWFPGLETLADKRVAQLLLVTHGCEFALGVLAFRVAGSGLTWTRGAALLTCTVGTLVQVVLAGRTVTSNLRLGPPDMVPAAAIMTFLACFALLISWNQAIVEAIPRRAARAIRFLGVSTYPLYLLHTFVGLAVVRFCRDLGMWSLPALATGMLAAFLAAAVTSAYAEPAVRRHLDRILGKLSL